MESQTEGRSQDDTWEQAKAEPKLIWIQIITGLVQFYCVLCHSVFLMVVVLWMFFKEVFRRTCKVWQSAYATTKHPNLEISLKTLLPEWLASSRIISEFLQRPEPVQVKEDGWKPIKITKPVMSNDVLEQNELTVTSSLSALVTREEITTNILETCESAVPSESPLEMTSFEACNQQSQASVLTVEGMVPPPKRMPCSISAVVEDKYARGIDTSPSSSSSVSIDAIDESSEEDEPEIIETTSKYSDCNTKSSGKSGIKSSLKSNGQSASPNSWKLNFGLQRDLEQNEGKKSRTERKSAQGTPSEKKFSLTPFMSQIKKACCRTLHAINREVAGCLSPQTDEGQKKQKSPTVIKKTEGKEDTQEKFRQVLHDLSVPDARESVHSSWNDGSSAEGTRAMPSSLSGSMGEMQRGLLDSFSEGGSGEFGQKHDAAREKSSPSFEGDLMESFAQPSVQEHTWGEGSVAKKLFVETEGVESGNHSFEDVFKSSNNPG